MGNTYLYGIVAEADEVRLGLSGVDGASPAHVVSHDGLGCVVSDYAGKEFGSLSNEEIVRSLLAHQRVVEEVMCFSAVLPVKFGTLLASEQDGRALLFQRGKQLASALASIRDKMEIEVAATWDTARVLEDVGREGEVVRAKEAIAERGQPRFEDQVRLGRMVKAHLDQRREAYRGRMMEFLGSAAVAATANPLLSDELVMNVAFLVEAARRHDFEARVEQLDQLFQNEISFRVIGPLPPYSFSTVEVVRLNSRQVEAARQSLGLPATFSEGEVRRAYRTLAAREQGQLIRGGEAAKATFRALRQACDLLARYCRVQDRAGEAPASETVDGVFLVAIRGSQGDEIEPTRFGALDPKELG